MTVDVDYGELIKLNNTLNKYKGMLQNEINNIPPNLAGYSPYCYTYEDFDFVCRRIKYLDKLIAENEPEYTDDDEEDDCIFEDTRRQDRLAKHKLSEN